MSRICIEKKTVSRSGKPVEVCAKYATQDEADNDIDIVPRNSNDNLGAYVANPLSGLGAAMLDTSTVVPILVGGLGGAAGFLVARKWGSRISPYVSDFAPVTGALAGVLVSLPLAWWRGPREAATGAVASVVVNAAIFGLEKMSLMGAYSARRIGAYTAKRIGAYTAQQVGALPAQSAVMPAEVKSRMRSSSRVYGRSYMG